MNRTERCYKIQNLLRQQGPLTLLELQKHLEVSRATCLRDLTFLRDRLGLPLQWHRDTGCYHLDARQGERGELPGLWFTAEEVQALLTLQHLLGKLVKSELLTRHTAPLQARLHQLLKSASNSELDQLQRRVRVIGQAQRQPQPGYFETIGAALTQRKQIELSYLARGTNQASLRTLCPQRLVHYRDHWYLDAWCHLRQSLRTFALDSVQAVKVLKHPAQDHNEAELDAHFSSGYGIFAGPPTQTAQLRFSPERAQWVRDEQWHPDQTSTANPDGSYDLHIPYSDPRELFMDIMKHGAHCDVLAPEELRLMVKSELVRMGNKYFLAGNESRRI